jgi:para-aminobenzoate synthetase/4-amino-4-deoxychorismate lyase
MSSAGEPTRAVRVPLDWTLEPGRAALLVRGDERPFALIGEWAGGGALIGSEPISVAAADDDPFALLDSQPVLEGADSDMVGGGWFGYLGYELGRRIEAVGASPPGAPTLPPFALAFYDHLLRLDGSGRWWFEALWSEHRAPALAQRLRVLRARATHPPAPQPFATAPWRSIPGPAGHRLAVDACRRRIHAGDLFQANICTRLQSRLRGAPLDLFVTASERLAPDRAAFLSGPWGAVASLSPELFLERHGATVRSAPIKGTRSADEQAELIGSEKDRAENVMIVDLVRNDLGRVCVPGSISVDALAEARAHVSVWHLVSEISGTLPDEFSDAALVRAAFPPGSVTGAPKVAALGVIAELESTPRSVYTGGVGFASPVAGLELSVAIRTFEFSGDQVWLGVGGGIVADSDLDEEARECATKADPLLAAIGATRSIEAARLTPTSTRPPTPPPARIAPAPVPRPDPRAGVFETLLVRDRRPLEYERHLARLARSVSRLYGAELPAELPRELLEAASAAPTAGVRMRLDARPVASRREVSIALQVTALPDRAVPVRLVPRTVPGGLGEHKWIDRRLLAALGFLGEGEPLLCDLDGFVLETGRASVFCVEPYGRVLTPPADGRILPGITRARVLELAPRLGLIAGVEPISLERLAAADELFVTGALGGVEPACLADGSAAGEPGPVTSRVIAALAGARLLAA